MSTELPVHREPDATFQGINIADFISGKESRYDIFIRVSPDHYVKVAHAGEAITMDRVRSYIQKGAKLLHLRRDDYRKYIGMAVGMASAVNCSTSLTADRKALFLKHATDLVVKDIYREPLEKEKYEQAAVVVEAVLNACSEMDALLGLLVSLRKSSDRVFFHSLAVSAHCALIARQLKWESPANIHKVAMAGLFHDIGMKELPPSLLIKPESSLSRVEAEVYRTHPARGSALLQSIEGVPAEVCRIVGQHHEDSSGRGYPAGLHRHAILPLSRLVGVANAYCNLVYPHEGMVPLRGPEAVQMLEQHNDLRFDQEFLMPLGQLLKKRKVSDVR